MADDGTRRITTRIDDDVYQRLREQYPSGISDSELIRRAAEAGLNAQENQVTKREFEVAVDEIITVLEEIRDELAH